MSDFCGIHSNFPSSPSDCRTFSSLAFADTPCEVSGSIFQPTRHSLGTLSAVGLCMFICRTPCLLALHAVFSGFNPTTTQHRVRYACAETPEFPKIAPPSANNERSGFEPRFRNSPPACQSRHPTIHEVSHSFDGLPLSRTGLLHPIANPGVRNVSSCPNSYPRHAPSALRSYTTYSYNHPIKGHCGPISPYHFAKSNTFTTDLPFSPLDSDCPLSRLPTSGPQGFPP